jgi:hypothetical protein
MCTIPTYLPGMCGCVDVDFWLFWIDTRTFNFTFLAKHIRSAVLRRYHCSTLPLYLEYKCVVCVLVV